MGPGISFIAVSLLFFLSSANLTPPKFSIGRITKDLLTNFCSVVDVVEPVKKFTDRITEGEEFEAHRAAGKIGKIYNVGLENWSPEDGTYTIIWKYGKASSSSYPNLSLNTPTNFAPSSLIKTRSKFISVYCNSQWCLGHLPDKALVSYLRRCITGLKSPGGIIIVKENLSTTGCDEYDKDDSSVTR